MASVETPTDHVAVTYRLHLDDSGTYGVVDVASSNTLMGNAVTLSSRPKVSPVVVELPKLLQMNPQSSGSRMPKTQPSTPEQPPPLLVRSYSSSPSRSYSISRSPSQPPLCNSANTSKMEYICYVRSPKELIVRSPCKKANTSPQSYQGNKMLQTDSSSSNVNSSDTLYSHNNKVHRTSSANSRSEEPSVIENHLTELESVDISASHKLCDENFREIHDTSHDSMTRGFSTPNSEGKSGDKVSNSERKVCLKSSEDNREPSSRTKYYNTKEEHSSSNERCCLTPSIRAKDYNVEERHCSTLSLEEINSLEPSPEMKHDKERFCSHSPTKSGKDHSNNNKNSDGRPLIRRSKHPSCRRNLAKEFEREMTFKPEINQRSLKIVSHSMRHNFPLINRLTERKIKKLSTGTHYTFVPKINPYSIKLAQERENKIDEVHARMAKQVSRKNTEVASKYTFKPQVSENSLRIAKTLGTSFEKRQVMHLEKRKKALEMAEAQQMARKKQSNNNVIDQMLNQSPRNSKQINSITSPCNKTPAEPCNLSRAESENSPNESCNHDPSSSDGSPEIVRSTEKIKPSLSSQDQARNEKNMASSQVKKKQKIHTDASSNRDPPSKMKSSVIKKKAIVGKNHSPPQKQHSHLEDMKFSSLSDRDRIKRVKAIADRKIKERKIFLIHGGYRLVRKCLRKRGWVELDYYKNKTFTPPIIAAKSKQKKNCVLEKKRIGDNSECDDVDDDVDDDSDADVDFEISDDEYSDEEEYTLVSRVARNSVPNFVWTLKREPSLYNSLLKSTITNHFNKAHSFTTKDDLCSNIRNVSWYSDTNPDTFFPRCYRLGLDEEREMFIDDYKFTAAIGILKILSHRHSLGETRPKSSSGDKDIPDIAVDLVLRAGEAFMGSKYHDDIENSELHLCPKVLESEWDDILKYHCKIIEGSQVLVRPDQISKVNHLLSEIEEQYPQFHIDGHRNIWIVKPGAMSRGRGISCLAKLKDIIDPKIVKRCSRWVVQKYMERPFLIYETKFDIRQWFLVTDWNPLTMWMYQDCYLRFSSQSFSLDCLDVSVHLCNNSIQRHYENSVLRSNLLPEENMWDSQTFQNYLSSIGKGDVWGRVIYPGMKKALINVLCVTQDEIEHKKNCFELYGADFMISNDLNPWLLEINSSPTMEASTEVTSRLCRQVLEDTLKVVIDRRENKDCDIGRFELAYKQAKVDVPPYNGIQLFVKGSAMTRHKIPPAEIDILKVDINDC